MGQVNDIGANLEDPRAVVHVENNAIGFDRLKRSQLLRSAAGLGGSAERLVLGSGRIIGTRPR